MSTPAEKAKRTRAKNERIKGKASQELARAKAELSAYKKLIKQGWRPKD